ncbi:1-aminocyclopropane-1-carboxylate deaminase/D-cysteine desulfhydrase [Persicitalea jodogahamensis]|uniref:1-aminocyclopropane-1-carboxylate deaminase n=1 Tax=Persicitalea jodogahamensis TaxID=402147 RepID=A0A8J3DBD9_9BACT|nr:pyridoxal-phosphate dependent enzyme [Persicitalea jodogahamensis]GHB78056.1 1-aminocyclopropane-1-carboxylate deaminase [Persicitalea jodogahamensis]
MLIPNLPTPLQPLIDEVTLRADLQLFIKRDDLIHPTVSGNKWRKLKYVLDDARRKGHPALLTFGGAWSNHLYATAAAGKMLGKKTIGVVRGEEYEAKPTGTLAYCREQGMELHYISRENYRSKDTPDFREYLNQKFNYPYIIPEGGSTALALPGVGEVVFETEIQLNAKPDHFAVAAGTGGTAAGLLATSSPTLAFSALKNGSFLRKEILDLAQTPDVEDKLHLFTDYHFGGYARHRPELLTFMQDFERKHKILIEHVYTGKMLFGLYDLIKKGFFKKGTTIVAIHTGGLQGRSHEKA